MSAPRTINALPAWTDELPDHALIDSVDVLPIFGYTSTSSLTNAIANGRIPQPTQRTRRSNRSPKRQWRLGELRSFIKERAA